MVELLVERVGVWEDALEVWGQGRGPASLERTETRVGRHHVGVRIPMRFNAAARANTSSSRIGARPAGPALP